MKRKDETEKQWMDRLRAERGLPPQTPEMLREERARMMMGRARAAVALLNGSHSSETGKMAAFLDIFHPEVQGTLLHLELMQEAHKRVPTNQRSLKGF